MNGRGQRLRGRRRRGRRDLSADEGFADLDRLPPEIGDLTRLRGLSLSNTRVADLSPLAGLTGLLSLSLDSHPGRGPVASGRADRAATPRSRHHASRRSAAAARADATGRSPPRLWAALHGLRRREGRSAHRRNRRDRRQHRTGADPVRLSSGLGTARDGRGAAARLAGPHRGRRRPAGDRRQPTDRGRTRRGVEARAA
jgi:hypothetical protein